MPTEREREYYRMGFQDGFTSASQRPHVGYPPEMQELRVRQARSVKGSSKTKRKLSAWNKFVKANSKKPRFRFANGKLKLKKMAIAFRKTPAGRKRK